MKKYSILTFVFLVLFVLDVSAAKRYWISSGAAKWNNTANWSATSGGSGGASVPGSSDTAYFNGSGIGNDTLDANVNIKRLDISSGYTGKIVQRTYTITIGSTGATLSGGTFEGGSGSITVSGAFTISGTAFTSTSGTFSSSANFTFSSGSFTHNSGKLKFTATNTITGSISLYQLEFAPSSSSTFTIASGTTLTVNDNLYYSGTASLAVNTGTVDVKKDIYLNNTGTNTTGGTGLIKVSGSAKQTVHGGSDFKGTMPAFEINKSDTLVLTDIICIGGNFTRTSGEINAGSSTVVFKDGVSKTISGNATLAGVIFYYYVNNGSYTISTGSSLTVKGHLQFSGDNGLTLNTGTIYAQGNFTINNTNTSVGGGTAKIVFNGSGTQKFTGSTTAGAGRLCSIEIAKTDGDSIKLYNTITVAGDWKRTSGLVIPGSSSVYFYNSKSISGTHKLNTVVFYGNTNATFSIHSGDTLTVGGTLLIANGAYIVKLDSGLIHAEGNITTTNTNTSSGGSALIKITGINVQTLTGSGAAGQGKLPKITIDKTNGYLNLASVISVSSNWTYIKGEVKPGSSSVALYGTINLDGQEEGGTSTMSFYDLGIASGTTTLTGNLDVDHNLTIASGATLSASSNTINVGGQWNSAGTWTYSTSTVVFDGNAYRQLTGASGSTVGFYNLTFNQTEHSLTLSRPVKVNHTMTLTKGHIITSSTNFLEVAHNATCTGGGVGAYVHGPMRKTGNAAFTFPLGDTTLTNDSAAFHPLSMTAPSSSTDQFEAMYRAIGQAYGSTKVDSLGALSDCEYWTLERKSGSSTVSVSASWNRSPCNVDEFDGLRLAEWNGTQWRDLGSSSVSVNDRTGTITAALSLQFSNPISPILIGRPKGTPPYAVLHKKLDGGYYQVNNGALYFRFDEEYNDADGKLTYKVYSDANNLVAANSISGEQAVYYGDNRYRLNPLQCQFTGSGSLTAGYFILEVTNEKNEKWYLRFKNNTSTVTVNCSNNGGSN